MIKIKRSLALSSITLGLISASCFAVTLPVSAAPTTLNAETVTIQPIEYQTVTGDNGAFIDMETDKFVLNQKEWFTIQAYVEGALGLPTTKAKMKSAMGIPDDIAFSDFQALLDEYNNIYDNAYYWKSDLYPEVVKLSLSLSNYSDIQKIMLKPLSGALTNILIGVEVEKNRKLAIAYIKSLKTFSGRYHDQVADISTNLLDFSAKLETEKQQLATLQSTHSKYLLDDGSEKQQEVNSLNSRIKQLNEDYDHYVTVAATAVTYAWCPFVAVPIMGVYGDKAEKARKLRNQLQNQLEILTPKLSMTQKIFNTYTRSTESINSISLLIDDAIPYVNKLKLHWQTMNTEFDSMLAALELAENDAEVLKLDAFVGAAGALANTAVVEMNWDHISEKAKQFANNAYIQKMEE